MKTTTQLSRAKDGTAYWSIAIETDGSSPAYVARKLAEADAELQAKFGKNADPEQAQERQERGPKFQVERD